MSGAPATMEQRRKALEASEALAARIQNHAEYTLAKRELRKLILGASREQRAMEKRRRAERAIAAAKAKRERRARRHVQQS